MFAVIFFILAFVGAGVQLALQKQPRTPQRILEVCFVWVAVVAIGADSIFGALFHLFDPVQTAHSIGWEPSPFQRENAFGDLGYGILGVLCIWLRGNFWEATVIMSSVSLLGDAYGHIYELVVNHDYAPNNTGALLAMDIIVPITAIVLLVLLRLAQRRYATQQAAALSGRSG